MQAKKKNKVYTIAEADKARYAKDGFDIYDDSGALISVGAGKTVPLEKYLALEKKLQELKASSGGSMEQLTVEELKAYAEEKGIDIGQATTQDGILKKIKAAQKE